MHRMTHSHEREHIQHWCRLHKVCSVDPCGVVGLHYLRPHHWVKLREGLTGLSTLLETSCESTYFKIQSLKIMV